MAIVEPITHTPEDGRYHTLRDHLKTTAKRAVEKAEVFGFSQWGQLAGLWQDLGKHSK